MKALSLVLIISSVQAVSIYYNVTLPPRVVAVVIDNGCANWQETGFKYVTHTDNYDMENL